MRMRIERWVVYTSTGLEMKEGRFDTFYANKSPYPSPLSLPLAYRGNTIIATKSFAQRIHQRRLARAHGPTHPHSKRPLQIIPFQGRLACVKGTRGFERLVSVAVFTMAVTMRMRMGMRVGVRVFLGGAALLLVVVVVVVMWLVVAVRVRVLMLTAVGVGVGVLACVMVVVVLMLPVPCKGRKRRDRRRVRSNTQREAISQESRTVAVVMVVRMLLRACQRFLGRRKRGVEDEGKLE